MTGRSRRAQQASADQIHAGRRTKKEQGSRASGAETGDDHGEDVRSCSGHHDGHDNPDGTALDPSAEELNDAQAEQSDDNGSEVMSESKKSALQAQGLTE